jgi:uncharacterized protein (TIGR03437 family)
VSAAFLLLAAFLFRPVLWAQGINEQAPSFSSDSIKNSANGSAASLTPNTIASIYGENLAYFTAEAQATLGAASLPNKLGGVQVIVGGLLASLYYASPEQINFVIPAGLLPGRTTVTVVRQATFARREITLVDAAPGLFVLPDGAIAATHADGSVITPESPALPGEIIVVYCTGLGRTDPRQLDGVIPRAAAWIQSLDRLRIILDDVDLGPASIYYAGITPGFPGLYQINLYIPQRVSKPMQELRVEIEGRSSQSALLLALAPNEP